MTEAKCPMTTTHHTYEIDGEPYTVILTATADGYQATIGARRVRVRAVPDAHGHLRLTVDDRQVRAVVAGRGPVRHVGVDGHVWALRRPDIRRPRRGRRRDADGALEAAMPGLVLDVLVREGDQVARGDTLVLLEAMKMELRIAAPRAGQVATVHCRPGAVVERGQRLVDLMPVDDASAGASENVLADTPADAPGDMSGD